MDIREFDPTTQGSRREIPQKFNRLYLKVEFSKIKVKHNGDIVTGKSLLIDHTLPDPT